MLVLTENKWNINLRASLMTSEDIAAELKYREAQWDEYRNALDEDDGHSGSPGEWLYERMDELQHEQSKRSEL